MASKADLIVRRIEFPARHPLTVRFIQQKQFAITTIKNQIHHVTNIMKKLTTIITSLIASAVIADTNPCYTQLMRTVYPLGQENGVRIYYEVKPSSAGVHVSAWHQSVAFYDLTFRATTVNRGVTNSTTELRPMVSAASGAINAFTTAISTQTTTQTIAAKSIIVPWTDLCNLRGNSGQIEMWICEPGKTNVLSYGIVRVDSN